MHRSILPFRRPPAALPGPGADRIGIVGAAAKPAPIVHFPVPNPPPPVTASADIEVKRFRGREVDGDLYTATLHSSSDSPAALLSALAGAAWEVEDLARAGTADDHLILRITIRR